jgi:NAD dependent epimerase/dehydratase
MSKVLVTGAAGFIGSHLTEKLVEAGNSVRAFVKYNSKNDWGWLESSPYLNQIEVISGDIRDFDSVLDAMKNVDEVYHLAALIGIPYSYVSPLAYIRTNVEGTYNILQAALKLEVPNVIVTSTSETYGTAQYVPIDEKHPLVGQSPYSATKIGADQLAISFFRSFNLPVKLVRPFNTFGPRQSARAIIPATIIQILNQQKNLNLGNLHPTRDLTYVKDTADGFIAIARSKECIGEVSNIGMNHEISIGSLVKMIANLMETRIEIKTDKDRIRPENSEVERLFCDNSKIKELTDWEPKYTFEAALKETIKWFRENYKIYKATIYNV